MVTVTSERTQEMGPSVEDQGGAGCEVTQQESESSQRKETYSKRGKNVPGHRRTSHSPRNIVIA